ncbi:unnamed protein product [Euphydryas editha]|uniref:Uncharacterized protein n=1 Tax=Euphydryas editha TaxID=104508 RepID=A0AAU9UYS5_EUPED|nr:unnamed protein product [Euphydryas editha]
MDVAQQEPTNVNPIPTTSKQTVNEQIYASLATSPSILYNEDEIQPEVAQKETSVSPAMILTTSYATTERSTIQEAHTVRSFANPSKSNETNTDNDQTVINFPKVVSIKSPQPLQFITNKDRMLKNKQHSEILTDTPMK